MISKKIKVFAVALVATLALPFAVSAQEGAVEVITEKQYQELVKKQKEQGGALTLDELAQKEAFEAAQLEKDQTFQARKALAEKVSESELISKEDKASLLAEIEKATLYDLLEVLPAKVDKIEKATEKANMAALEASKEPVRKAIYESKLDEATKESLFSELAKAKDQKAVKAVVEKLAKLGVKANVTEETKATEKAKETKATEKAKKVAATGVASTALVGVATLVSALGAAYIKNRK